MLAEMSGLQLALGVFYLLICLLLIGVVLLQKGRGGGLGSAFGGSGGTASAFGAKTGDVFTWVTVVLAVACLLTAVISNYAFVPEEPAAPVVQAAPGTGQPPPGATPPPTGIPPVGDAPPPAGQTAPPGEAPGTDTGEPQPPPNTSSEDRDQ